MVSIGTPWWVASYPVPSSTYTIVFEEELRMSVLTIVAEEFGSCTPWRADSIAVTVPSPVEARAFFTRTRNSSSVSVSAPVVNARGLVTEALGKPAGLPENCVTAFAVTLPAAPGNWAVMGTPLTVVSPSKIVPCWVTEYWIVGVVPIPGLTTIVLTGTVLTPPWARITLSPILWNLVVAEESVRDQKEPTWVFAVYPIGPSTLTVVLPR